MLVPPKNIFSIQKKNFPPIVNDGRFCVFLLSTQKHFFAYRRKADLSFPLVLPRYHHLACLPAFALKTTLYKSRSMLSIDGRLVLKFHSRQKLFSKIPWHLLKTRHLVRNSSDPKLFPKIFRIDRSQLLLDGRFGPKFHLAQTFFATRLSSFSVLCCPLQFSTVCYGTTHAR